MAVVVDARARRRGLSDAALGRPRRHLAYKTGWYGPQLVVADRWFPSSKTCPLTGLRDDTPAGLRKLSVVAGSSRCHGGIA